MTTGSERWRSSDRILPGLLRRLLRIGREVRTLVTRRLGLTDHWRWSTLKSLNPSWDARTRLLTTMVPYGSRVLEWGAGRAVAREMLPADCSYTATDITDRGGTCIPLDLNCRPLPGLESLPVFDCILASGVLEYVVDLHEVILHFASRTEHFVVSYATTEASSPRDRLEHGWLNDYSHEKLTGAFSAAGYFVSAECAWRGQTLFRFSRIQPRTS